MKIYIPIPTYNRLEITKLSLQNLSDTLKRYPFHEIVVDIQDDQSAYNAEKEFEEFNFNKIVRMPEKLGIHRLRVLQMKYFLMTYPSFDFIYLTDSDAIHDPQWLNKAIELFEKYQKPISLYNTIFHQDWGVWQNPEVSMRQFSAGISLFLHRAHVQALFPAAESIDHEWDFKVNSLLGNQIIHSRTSYVDHYGKGGIHSNNDWNRDHAINPTPFLQKTRFDVIKKLEQKV